MSPDAVRTHLTNYRANQARYNHLYLEAMTMAMQINAEARKALANDSMHAQQYNDMPKGNQLTKTVEELAIRYADGFIPETLRDWMEESEAMHTELRQLETSIAYVDTWLGGLGETDRIIVTAHDVDDLTWPEVAINSPRLLGYHMSPDGLRKRHQKAMQQIYDIAR